MTPTNQSRIAAWVRTTFDEATATNIPERALRLAEEALELTQACGVEAVVLHRLVDYVFSRPTGEPAQEIAGTMVTLYSAAHALGVDADAAFEAELERIQQPEVIERVRRRQDEKRAALVGNVERAPSFVDQSTQRPGHISGCASEIARPCDCGGKLVCDVVHGAPVDLGFNHNYGPLTDEQVARVKADLERRAAAIQLRALLERHEGEVLTAEGGPPVKVVLTEKGARMAEKRR